MDAITLRSMEDMPVNFIGAEQDNRLASGVMNIANDGFGHKIAELFLSEFERSINSTFWGETGPGVVTRVMLRVCNGTLPYYPKTCNGFHIFPPYAFYAIPWREWRDFFETKKPEEKLARTDYSHKITLILSNAQFINKQKEHRSFPFLITVQKNREKCTPSLSTIFVLAFKEKTAMKVHYKLNSVPPRISNFVQATFRALPIPIIFIRRSHY
uniref:Gb3_synth domain-containing protein n=1 Tax=Glossina brevipalpis TaxID=37001 RepID=A0A1A9WNU9_9MUSC